MQVTRPTSPLRLDEWMPSVGELEHKATQIQTLTRACRATYEIYRGIQADLQKLRKEAVREDPEHRDAFWRVQLRASWKEMRAGTLTSVGRAKHSELARLSSTELESLSAFVAGMIDGQLREPSDNAVFGEWWTWLKKSGGGQNPMPIITQIIAKKITLRRLENKYPKLGQCKALKRQVLFEARQLSETLRDLRDSALGTQRSSEALVKSLSARVTGCTPQELESVLCAIRDAKQDSFVAEQNVKQIDAASKTTSELRQRLVNLMTGILDSPSAIIHPKRWEAYGDYPIPIKSYRWQPKSGSLLLYTSLGPDVDCQRSYWIYWDESRNCLVLRCYAIPSVQEGAQLSFDLRDLELTGLTKPVGLRVWREGYAPQSEHVTVLHPCDYDASPRWQRLPH